MLQNSPVWRFPNLLQATERKVCIDSVAEYTRSWTQKADIANLATNLKYMPKNGKIPQISCLNAHK